jgi:hypothetical protein
LPSFPGPEAGARDTMGSIIKVIDTKNKLVKAYKRREVFVRY